MPWTADNPPSPAKNAPAAERRACVAAANAALKRTGDEGEAIQACIGAMKNVRNNAMPTLRELLEKYAKETDDDISPDTVFEDLSSEVQAWLEEHGFDKKKRKNMGFDEAAYPEFRSGHGDTDHVHEFDPDKEFSSPPLGVPNGHRHRLQRNAENRVIGLEEVEGHVHPLFDEFDLEEPHSLRQHEQLRSLSDVEIFAAGTWNGDKYTEKDLDEMVRNFDEVGFEVPLKLGHEENSGDPAYGWVESVRRVGSKLIANFRDLPDKIYKAIKDRRYDTVSSEIFWNIRRDGKKFRRALKAVALLGAEIPAVSGLRPLRESLMEEFSDSELRAVHVHSLGKETFMDKDKETVSATLGALAVKLGLEEGADQATIEAKIAELSQAKETGPSALEIKELREDLDATRREVAEARQREREVTISTRVDKCSVPSLREHARALYALAMADEAPKTVTFVTGSGDQRRESEESPLVVLDQLIEQINKNAAKLFGEVSGSPHERRSEPAADDAGAELDKLVKARMSEKGEDYRTAFRAVRADPANTDVARAYARGRQ